MKSNDYHKMRTPSLDNFRQLSREEKHKLISETLIKEYIIKYGKEPTKEELHKFMRHLINEYKSKNKK